VDARLILAALLWLPLPAAAFEHEAWKALSLNGYLESLSGVKPAQFDAWPRREQMAFLINAYNAFTVEKILTRYPDIRSIWDFGKLFGNAFKDEFFVLLESRRSPDWIDHEKLRKEYADPRVHCALNCASVGCPMLREEAYVAARPKIFDWFRQDFEPRRQYFAAYASILGDDAGQREAIRSGKLPLRFLDYDWSLNDKSR
jgi:uncharacterized protein DUF547